MSSREDTQESTPMQYGTTSTRGTSSRPCHEYHERPLWLCRTHAAEARQAQAR